MLFRSLAVFVAATVLATIYLGWHFALDDVAGLLIAAVAVRLGHWLVWGREARAGTRSQPVTGTRGRRPAAGVPHG